MKLTLGPRSLVERAALWLNRAPVPFLQAFGPMMSARVVMAGEELGIYGALSEGEAHADVLAQRLGLAPLGTRLLLDALAGLGLVKRSGLRYRLARRSRRWLQPGSRYSAHGLLQFNFDQWEWWSSLERHLREGSSAALHAPEPGDPRWRRYAAAMEELARIAAPEVATRLRLPRRARRVLDLGGSHGRFSTELCRRHRALEAVVLDLPGSARVGRELLQAVPGHERVHFVEGDFLSDELGGPYDAVLAFQILHHLPQGEIDRLLARIRAALRPGGTLAVLEQVVPSARAPPGWPSLLSLHFLLASGGRSLSLQDLQDALGRAGFPAPARHLLRRLPAQTLLLTRRPLAG